MNFPSVTICNQNRVHCNRLKEVTKNCSGEMDLHCAKLEDIKLLACFEDDNVTPKPNNSNVPASINKENNVPARIENENVPASIDKENIFLFFYMNTAVKTRVSIGHQLSDMLASCTFKGKDCPSG